MAQNQAAKNQKRPAKLYDEIPNRRIRQQMEALRLTADTVSKRLADCGIEVTSEAVRQWKSGYTCPEVGRLKAIADALECSCNYLLEIAETPIANNESIREQLGLSDITIASLLNAKGAVDSEPLGDIKPTSDYFHIYLDIANRVLENSHLIIALRNYWSYVLKDSSALVECKVVPGEENEAMVMQGEMYNHALLQGVKKALDEVVEGENNG